MLSRTTEVIHEFITKDLTCNAIWLGHPLCRRLQRLRQHSDLSASTLEKYINFGLGGHTFPAFLSSGLKCETGGPGSDNFFSMPLKPSPKIALNAKNGLTSAPGTRISKRVAAGGTEGGEITLTEAARES